MIHESAPQVETIDLAVRYVRRRQALDKVSISLGAGVTALLGENGAGKTTLLRVLATVLRPSSGQLLFRGEPVDVKRNQGRLRRTLGYLPQSVEPVRTLTAIQYLEYFAWLKGLPGHSIASEATSCLSLVDLQDQARLSTHRLSGGQLRRLGIATALLGSPSLILLDEPTAGLDPAQRLELRALVQQMGADRTVLISTHLTDDVAALADNVVVLGGGRVLFDGPLTDFVGLAATPDQQMPSRPSTPGLASPAEQAFLSLVRPGA